MSRWFTHITQSRLLRNSAKLLSANVIAQVIGLIVYPILTRLYSPEDFGLLNLFLSIGGILVLLSTAEYQYAIVLPKREKEACTVFHVAFRVLLVATGVILLSVPFSRAIASVFDAPQLAVWYWAMPVYVFTMGLWSLLNYYYTRRQAFNRISCYQLSQSVISASSKVGLGYAGWLQGGMILGSVFAPLLSVVGSMLIAWKKGCLDIFCRSSKDERKQMAQQYANFPKFSLPRALVNNVGGNMPALLLTPFFGLNELGFFAMAMTLAFRPISMIANAMYQPLFSKVSELVNAKKSILPFHCKYLRNIILTCILFILIYFITPQLVRVLLGEGWEQTAVMIRIMLPWLAAVLIVSPLAYIADVFGKQRLFFILEVTYFIFRIVALFIGCFTHNFMLAIIGLSSTGVLILSIQMICYWKIIKKYEETLAY